MPWLARITVTPSIACWSELIIRPTNRVCALTIQVIANTIANNSTAIATSSGTTASYAEDIATIITAIGNHDESTGTAVSDISSAIILADKSDACYTRVRNTDVAKFDIHDRVNYSVKESKLEIDAENKLIILSLTIDTEISSVMNYFEIFLTRMLMCQKAAEKLGLVFGLSINGQKLL